MNGQPDRGMSEIVKTMTRLVSGFILVFGAYIVIFGHLTPGGGFAGGIIIAFAFLLLTLSFGQEVALSKFSLRATHVWDAIGASAFLAIALLGFAAARPDRFFFFNLDIFSKTAEFELLSAGSIPLSNVAIGIKVGACLFGVFIALSLFRRDKSEAGSGEKNK